MNRITMAPTVAENVDIEQVGELAADEGAGDADEDVGENAVTGFHHPSRDPSGDGADDQHREEPDAGLA
jgi:hypothetical protein